MKTEYARRQMIEQQVRAWDVADASVLSVLSELRRERFVPAKFEQLAFADIEIPLPHGQLMMTPIVEGRLLQALALDARDNVLEVGTGTGYLTACLAKLSATVTSVDIFSDFVSLARSNLDEARIENIELICMDAMRELPKGQFDAIAITGSLPVFDTRFIESLKPGGRLFVIVGRWPAMEARLVTRTGEADWTEASLFETDILPLLNAAGPREFAF